MHDVTCRNMLALGCLHQEVDLRDPSHPCSESQLFAEGRNPLLFQNFCEDSRTQLLYEPESHSSDFERVDRPST